MQLVDEDVVYTDLLAHLLFLLFAEGMTRVFPLHWHVLIISMCQFRVQFLVNSH